MLCTWFDFIRDARELGRYAAALKCHRGMIERSPGLLGDDHPRSLPLGDNLAVDLRKVGEHEEVLTTAERVRAGLVYRYGDDSTESMAATLELAFHGQAGR